MLSENVMQLKDLIIQNVAVWEWDTSYGLSGGLRGYLPKFELTATDYLNFAEQEVEKRTSVGMINCVSHLKRAMDCQLDTFLYVLNLYKLVSEKGLGIDKKLTFISEIGVFSSRTLSRLNKIRNEMEHEYKVPSMVDIEAYFDLITAFVGLLQKNLLVLSIAQEIKYVVLDQNEKVNDCFCIGYNLENATIYAEWQKKDSPNVVCRADISDMSDFTYLFRLYLRMYEYHNFQNDVVLINGL